VSGSKVVSQNGNYGTQGTPALTNVPGARQDSVTWTDTSGNLWLFGGFGLDMNGTLGGGALNDLWKYNISSGEWTWVSGSFVANQNGSYGTQGTAGAGNSPGARFYAVGWIDKQGNLWLFGGAGFDATGAPGALSDLWKFTVSSGEWTYVGGPSVVNQNGVYGTQGTPALANNPGGRSDLFSWTDPSGNFWLFGGFGLDSVGTNFASGGGELNDLWMYNTTSGEWTWMNGPKLADQDPIGVYGTQGAPAPGNIPGSREGGASWADTSGNLWLFAGSGFNAVNDLWMYFP
jgi:hypothetical protein